MSRKEGDDWKHSLSRLKNPWSLAVLAIFTGSIFFELAEGYEVIHADKCTFQQEQHERWSERLYGPLMWLHFGRLRKPLVGVVTISSDSEPLKVINNTCEGRRFLSALVPELKKRGATMVVIDKFYSEGSCDDDDINKEFRAALTEPVRSSFTASNIPVVVGQAAHERKTATGKEACLQAAEPFDFGGPGANPDGPAVVSGLTRLNSDSLKIPLEWIVLPTAAEVHEGHTKEQPREGLAFKAATLLDAGITRRPEIIRALELHEHPFGKWDRLPHWSAMDVLRHTDHLNPLGSGLSTEKTANNLEPALGGKIIVIGEYSDTDLQPTRGADQYGVDLQASYIESLLDRTYVRRIPLWGELSMLLGFVSFTYILELLEDRGSISAWRSYRWWAGSYLLLILFNLVLLIFDDRLSSIFLAASWVMLVLILLRGAYLLRLGSMRRLRGSSEGRKE